jgi:diguanylate cyclase (GGDEF)-like protein
MPRKPRIIDRMPPAQHDPVATMMAMLLPIHSAVTLEWLADATATAAERTMGAAHTFVYLEEQDGALAWRTPSSDLRRRSIQRVIDAVGDGVLDRVIDPANFPSIAEALDSGHPLVSDAETVLGPRAGGERAVEAQESLGIDSVVVAPLHSAGERIGALLLFAVGTPETELVRLFAEHVACAVVNLRQTLAAREAPTAGNVVRTVFDARKTESELQREIMRAGRFKRDVSVCVIEATNLRLLRERFGQALTEQILEQAGEALAAQSRDIDVIGQYKGSGFTMVLSEVSPDGVQLAARRLLAAAVQAGSDAGVPGLDLHLACGWATWPSDGKSVEALFAAAERRMYDPKTQVA